MTVCTSPSLCGMTTEVIPHSDGIIFTLMGAASRAKDTMPCEVVVALVWFARMKLNWHARMKLNCLDARVQEETQAVHAHARARTHTHTHTHTQVHTNTHTNTHTHPFRLVIFGFDGAMACTCFMLTLSAGGTCSYCQAETKKG